MKRFFSQIVRVRELLDERKVLKPKEFLALRENERYRMPQVKPYESFEEVPRIDAQLLQRIQGHGLVKPTSLQGSLLYHFFTARKSDLLLKGCPGSGKSIGYLIALLAQKGQTDKTRHLVLVPTEQLRLQLLEAIKAFSPLNHSIIHVDQPESFALKLAQGFFNWQSLETVVLDEADALVKPLKKYSTSAQKRSRSQHPVPTIQLLSQLWALFRQDSIRKELRPRLLICSATLNRGTKHALTEAGIVHEGGRSCISIDIPEKEDETLENEIIEKSEKEGERVKQRSYKHLLLRDPQSVDELIRKLKIPLQGLGDQCALILLPAEQSKFGLISLLQGSFPGVRFGLLSEGLKEGVNVLVGSDVDVRGLNIPRLQSVIILDLPRSSAHFTHIAGRVGRSFNPFGTVWTILGTAKDYQKYLSMMSQLNLLSLPVTEITEMKDS